MSLPVEGDGRRCRSRTHPPLQQREPLVHREVPEHPERLRVGGLLSSVTCITSRWRELDQTALKGPDASFAASRRRQGSPMSSQVLRASVATRIAYCLALLGMLSVALLSSGWVRLSLGT